MYGNKMNTPFEGKMLDKRTKEHKKTRERNEEERDRPPKNRRETRQRSGKKVFFIIQYKKGIKKTYTKVATTAGKTAATTTKHDPPNRSTKIQTFKKERK